MTTGSLASARTMSSGIVLLYSDRLHTEPYASLTERNQRWAALRGYAYRTETERRLSLIHI